MPEVSVEKQARRMAVGAMLVFAVFGGAIAAATIRQNSSDEKWQGAPRCPPVAVGDAVDARVQPVADSICYRTRTDGTDQAVSRVEYAPCADGRRLYVIDRRDVDGLDDVESIVVYGYTGSTFAPGPLPDAVKAQCQG